MTITYTIPVKIISKANRQRDWRSHYYGNKKRGIPSTKGQKDAAFACTLQATEGNKFTPYMVIMTRVYSGREQSMDDDGLTSGFKHVRDGIALALGFDDKDPRVQWPCRQERGETTEVRVEIRR